MAKILTKNVRKRIARGHAGFYCGPIVDKEENARRREIMVAAYLEYGPTGSYSQRAQASLASAVKKHGLDSAIALDYRSRLQDGRRAYRQRMEAAAGLRNQHKMCWYTQNVSCHAKPVNDNGIAQFVPRNKGHFRHVLRKGDTSWGAPPASMIDSRSVWFCNRAVHLSPMTHWKSEAHKSYVRLVLDYTGIDVTDKCAAIGLMANQRAARQWQISLGTTDTWSDAIHLGHCRRSSNAQIRGLVLISDVRQKLLNRSIIDAQLHDGMVHLRIGDFVRHTVRESARRIIDVGPSPWNDPNGDPFVGLELELLARNCANKQALAERILLHNKDLKKFVGIAGDGSVGTAPNDPTNGATVIAPLEVRMLAPMSQLSDVLSELHKAMASEGGIYTNVTCGMHVHSDMRGTPDGERNKAVRNLICALPVLANIVHPDRKTNTYCRPNDRADWSYGQSVNRHSMVNPTALDRHSTIETRLHHGYEDPKRTVLWARLVRAIMDAPEFPGVARLIKHVTSVVTLSDDLHEYMMNELKRWHGQLVESQGFLIETPEMDLSRRIVANVRVDPWTISDMATQQSERIARLEQEIINLRQVTIAA